MRDIPYVLSALFCLICTTAGMQQSYAAPPAKPMQDGPKIVFNRDIRPILSDNCFACHGPDKKKLQAGLRLDQPNGAVVPGKVAASELVRRINTVENDGSHMPPVAFHKRLTLAQKQLLTRWIAEGGRYQKHWAYEPLVKVAIPAGQNPVDFLVRKRLAEIGLKPAPAAERRTLIRRLSFDLLGLPPTPAEVTAFSKDTAPNAYANLVDRLLASPHYGERMAQSWLDVVRYADTIGYHSDNARNIWPYRDWVIDAFNRNKPFDRFTMEQLAGDLVPDANQETRIGSAFNRLILSTEEGGAQSKDYEARYLTDRVRAVGTVWLGQTTGCAQCHDHKFDPILTRDFYALGAYFADIDEPIIGGRGPGMLLANADQTSELAQRNTSLTNLQTRFDGPHPELAPARLAWEKSVRDAVGTATPPVKIPADIQTVVALPMEKRTPEQTAKLDAYYRSIAPELATARAQVADALKSRNEYESSLPHCLVTVRNTTPRIVRVLPRGNFLDESGEVVQPATPAFLPGRTGGTRLDLAKWMVSRQNPLTARTVINRLWKQFYGIGLSKNLEDLGAQGEPPTNPALLDWLACEFMDSGWDIKHMVRILVNNATYRQVSTAEKALLTRDPYNREFARQSRFRLEAEEVRDNALAISGLLSLKIGGPSVKPYQPDRYWDNLNFPTREYAADKGGDQYRRGLYTWWQRSFLHPSLLAFDAPSREECTAERNRSNIPQQALVLLNDPTYLEAARVFGYRILTSEDKNLDAKSNAKSNEKLNDKPNGTSNKNSNGNSTINLNDALKRRLVWAWQQALQRAPTPAELNALQQVYQQQREVYITDRAAADALLKTGNAPVPENCDPVELAAWTHVARVLLNLHETITRS